MTHAELVEVAQKWLQKRCAVVIAELSVSGEIPDAIGWSGNGYSYLIECKTSVADFRADKNKWFRQFPERGIGCRRWYMAPKGILALNDIPKEWGLLEWDGRRVFETKEPENLTAINYRHEINILISTLRRLGKSPLKTVSLKCYTIETKNKATLGLSTDAEEFLPPTSAS